MERVRVVFLIRRTVGGMQTHLVDLISGLDPKKYEPIVIAPFSKQLEKRLDKLHLKSIWINIEDKISLIKDLKSISKLRRTFKHLKPDIIHIHGNKSALVGRIAANLARTQALIIVTVHNFLIYQQANLFKRKVACWIEKYLAKGTHKIIAVSARLKNSLVSIEGIPENKIVTIHNGISMKKWDEFSSVPSFRVSLEISEDAFLVGNIGRLVWWKGHKILLESLPILLKNHPEVVILIVGEGPEMNQIKKVAVENNLQKQVKFLGFVPDIRPYLSIFDVFVLPSLKEPFGIVILEAMAAKRPVVATRAGGVPEIITDGVNGLLVESGNPEAIAEGIDRIISNPELREKVAEQGYRDVRSKFSLEKMVEETEKVYQKALASKRKAT